MTGTKKISPYMVLKPMVQVTESKFKRVSGKFHVDNMDCLIDGVRIEDKCAARCINSTCTGFFLDVQGCCILRPVDFYI